MAVDHGLLHGVQSAIGFFQTLNRFNRLAIKGWQQLNATVHGHIVNTLARRIQGAHHDHTSPAVAFSTTLLGARAMQLFAQVI